jgi:hypothetical protein
VLMTGYLNNKSGKINIQAHFTLIQHGRHRKRHVQQLYCCVTATTNTRKNVRTDGRSVFYAVRVVSDESRQLVLPRTSLNLAAVKSMTAQVSDCRF